MKLYILYSLAVLHLCINKIFCISDLLPFCSLSSSYICVYVIYFICLETMYVFNLSNFFDYDIDAVIWRLDQNVLF